MAERVDGVITPVIDRERERLAAELGRVNEELAAARIEREDIETRLRSLAALHDRLLAPLFAELDGLKAEIAELLAERSGLETDREDAARARERAEQSARMADRVNAAADDTEIDLDALSPSRAQPSEQARELFRALIKQCHPDLGTDEADSERRRQFSCVVNDAYADGDVARLEHLTREWALCGGSLEAAGTPQELAASVEAARAELEAVREEIEALARSSLGRLLLADGDALERVRSLARRVEGEIGRQRDVLARLWGRP